MSSLAASDERAVPTTAKVIQPAWVRTVHWINAVAMILMIMSGWQIYNASPLFNFLKFSKSITLGDWLGGALLWHFAAMWLLMINGLAYLAVGEMLLVLPGRTVTRLTAATMLFLTFAATAAVLAARVDPGELARAGATPPNGAIKGPWTTVMAIGLNSAGTLVLLAGSILSARRRRDPRPLLVAAGVLVIALASSATRLGSYTLFALAQAAGVTLILLGLVTRRRSRG